MTIPLAHSIELTGEVLAADLSPRVLMRVVTPDGVTTFAMTDSEADGLALIATQQAEVARKRAKAARELRG